MPHSAVVRIYATTQSPDYDAPWQARTPRSSTGSGMVYAKGRVLTGAHVVANATFLQVQKVHDPRKYIAKLIGVCHDADLALLEVQDEAFSEGVEPVTFGELPRLQARVSVVGFPVGGEEVSVTVGVVSRIEVQRYSHSKRQLLAITVDAAINAGNSGGPVFSEGKVIGVAFQSLTHAENIGEVVPTVLIRRFLSALDAGRPLDVPSLSLRTQSLENPVLRRSLGMSPDQSGVMVRTAEYGGSAHGQLQPGDVLLSMDGHRISNNGRVVFHDSLRTRYDALLSERFVGDHLPVTVRRGDEVLHLELTLTSRAHLVPRSQHDVQPRYYIYGGFVFQPLTLDFLSTWTQWWLNAPKEFIHLYFAGERTEAQRERVALTQVLADASTVGYTDRTNELIEAVNGVAPRDLEHLVQMLEAATGVVTLKTSWRARIVLDVDQVRSCQQSILTRYHIPKDRSGDLHRISGADRSP